MAESHLGPITPELVLVSPDLRAALMREFAERERADAAVRDDPAGPMPAGNRNGAGRRRDAKHPEPPAAFPIERLPELAARRATPPPSVPAARQGAQPSLVVGTAAYLVQRVLVLAGQAAAVLGAVVVAIVALELLTRI